MPVCVDCNHPIKSLYTVYSKDAIALNQCEKCKKFADGYVENDGVIIFIDMLLHKPQVYRHLLINTASSLQIKSLSFLGLERFQLKISPQVIKMAFGFLLFEVYHLWETMVPNATLSWINYTKIFFLAILEFLILALVIFSLVRLLRDPLKFSQVNKTTLCIALITSSFPNVLHTVAMIWDYREIEFTFLITLMIFISNLEAISAVLQTPYRKGFLVLLPAYFIVYIVKHFIHFQL